MSNVCLQDATILFEGERLTIDDLVKKIQDNMTAGEFKIANIASALEWLQTALENSHTMEVKLVITKAEYEELKVIDGKDDNDRVRKAIMAYIGNGNPAKPKDRPSVPKPPPAMKSEPEEPAEEVDTNTEETDIKKEKKKPRFIDHFLGKDETE